jgi:hypothetical protein
VRSNNMVGQLKVLFVSLPPPSAAATHLAPRAVLHWESSIKFFCEVCLFTALTGGDSIIRVPPIPHPLCHTPTQADQHPAASPGHAELDPATLVVGPYLHETLRDRLDECSRKLELSRAPSVDAWLRRRFHASTPYPLQRMCVPSPSLLARPRLPCELPCELQSWARLSCDHGRFYGQAYGSGGDGLLVVGCARHGLGL